jgi:hypothetical protein
MGEIDTNTNHGGGSSAIRMTVGDRPASPCVTGVTQVVRSIPVGLTGQSPRKGSSVGMRAVQGPLKARVEWTHKHPRGAKSLAGIVA